MFMSSAPTHPPRRMTLLCCTVILTILAANTTAVDALVPLRQSSNIRPSGLVPKAALGTGHSTQFCSFGNKEFFRHRGRVVSLCMKQDRKNNDDDVDETKNSWIEGVSKKIEELMQRMEDVLPAPLVKFLRQFWTKISEILPGFRIAAISFFAGLVLATGAILLPVYNSVESLSEPIVLFETILADLDQGYVDPVDTKKLFETGVSAMLRSLDPYTEFEARDESEQLKEGIQGRYGGVGLVISGASYKDTAKITPTTSSPATSDPTGDEQGSKLLPQEAIEDKATLEEGDASIVSAEEDDENLDEFDLQAKKDRRRAIERAKKKGIRVVSAMEGYAFDYGMRVGDKIVAIDSKIIDTDVTVDQVRNLLRGEPGTMVTIRFERDGVEGVQEISMPRRIIQLHDVKLVTLIGNPSEGIGYISLSGFAQSAGQEVRQAILSLERATEIATNGDKGLQGLILDLRGNPGGLLTSAVDVASLLVPKGSDIVSAKGRGFPGVIYRSRNDPILRPDTKLAVLVNSGTASAAEIVSGAIQDLDVGIIVGNDRTFGKGLVQNVEDLPFNTALKFTVAKYYTPSGRCIQGVNYKEGGGLREEDGRFESSKVSEKDRQPYYTRLGRVVRSGGGIEADFKVSAPKASALEITLLRSDILSEFASNWVRKHKLTSDFQVNESTYRDFISFVESKQEAGEIKLEGLYAGALGDLKRALKQSGYKTSEKEVERLQADIINEVKKDFERYKADIKEDISNSILARYLPESMILERSLRTDRQVEAAVELVRNGANFDKILAKGSRSDLPSSAEKTTLKIASSKLGGVDDPLTAER